MPDEPSARDVAASSESGSVSPPIAIGPYRLIKELGRGGQGVVYLAEHESESTKVALKVLDGLSSQNEATLARFRREAFTASAIDHPGICGIVEAGIDSRTPYIAMQYVEGETLAQRLAQARTESAPTAFNLDLRDADSKPDSATPTSSLDRETVLDAVSIIEQAARAVHAAHEKGVIHRDLKPANIMISKAGPPVILDFGLAHHEDPGLETLTRTGDLIGTPAYMSPEQLSRQLIRLDRRTDVWSLGVCLYEAITLQRPFEAPTRERLYQAILTKEPLPASRVNTVVSSELDVVLQTALDKDRDRRYQTALDFAEDLRNVRVRAPILAQAPSAWTRFSRWARRNPAVASLIAGVFLALAGGLVVALLLLAKVAAAKERADESAKAEETAKLAAERKRIEAETNLTYAKSANDVLSSVFLDLEPERTYRTIGELRGALRDNLAKAFQKLDTIAVGDPLEVAAMQQTLAGSLMRLGDRAAAIPVLERVVATKKAAVGADDPATLSAMNMLANAYTGAGRIEEGLALQGHVHERSAATLGRDHPSTLGSLGNLGLTLLDAGRRQEALACFEEASQGFSELRGPNDSDAMHWTIGLAMACKDVGERDRSLALLVDLLPRLEAIKGRDHPETIQCLMNIGAVKSEMGKPDPKLLEDVLARARDRVGPDHPYALFTANSLGLAWWATGQSARAVPLLEETLPRMKAVFGPTHPDTLSCMNNLGLVYRDSKQLDKAFPLLEGILEIQKSTQGPGHERTLAAANSLGSAHQAAGQPARAIEVFEAALTPAREVLGEDHDTVILVMHNLAGAYDELKQHDRSPELRLKAAHGIARGGFRHKNAKVIFDIAIGALEYFERLEDVVELLRKRVDFVKERSGAESREYASELALLGENLLRQKKWGEAEAVLRPCLAIREKTDAAAWLTCNAKSMLGGALLGQRKLEDAEPMLLAACEGMKAKLGSVPKPRGAEMLAVAMDRLIELYAATGRQEEAARWSAARDSLLQAQSESRPPR